MKFSDKLAMVARRQYEVDREISTEGLLQKIKELFKVEQSKKNVPTDFYKSSSEEIIKALQKTLAERRWVEQRFMTASSVDISAEDSGFLYIDGKVVNPTDSTRYVETVIKPYCKSLQYKLDELGEYVNTLDSKVRKLVDDEASVDEVNAAVQDAILRYKNHLRMTISKIQLPSPVAPGDRQVIRKGAVPELRIMKAKAGPLKVQSLTVDDIVDIGQWILRELADRDTYYIDAASIGLDHSDGSDFNHTLQDVYWDAYDDYYETLSLHRTEDDFEAFAGYPGWFDIHDYCEWLVKYCLYFIKD